MGSFGVKDKLKAVGAAILKKFLGVEGEQDWQYMSLEYTFKEDVSRTVKYWMNTYPSICSLFFASMTKNETI